MGKKGGNIGAKQFKTLCKKLLEAGPAVLDSSLDPAELKAARKYRRSTEYTNAWPTLNALPQQHQGAAQASTQHPAQDPAQVLAQDPSQVLAQVPARDPAPPPAQHSAARVPHPLPLRPQNPLSPHPQYNLLPQSAARDNWALQNIHHNASVDHNLTRDQDGDTTIPAAKDNEAIREASKDASSCNRGSSEAGEILFDEAIEALQRARALAHSLVMNLASIRSAHYGGTQHQARDPTTANSDSRASSHHTRTR